MIPQNDSFIGAEDLAHFGDIPRGRGGVSEILPPTALPKSKRESTQYKKDLLDALERIGYNQYMTNLKYNDYFKMIRGELVYSDILDEDITVLKGIETLRSEIELPTSLRHYDFIGQILNVFVGEWMQQKNKFFFDSVDEVSTNEYIRHKTDLLQESVNKKLQAEITKRMLMMGYDLDRQFESEEEQQQYAQMLQQKAAELTPESIESDMKNWKTLISKWAKKTYDRDFQRFKMDMNEMQEAFYKLITGKAPRAYVIGFDYYKPESWNPINTFYSKEIGTDYFENKEYVGRVMFYPFHQLMDRIGYKLSKTQIENISNKFYGKYTNRPGMKDKYSTQEIIEKQGHEKMWVPFKGADGYQVMTNFQDALGIPMGEMETPEGLKDVWLPGIDDTWNFTNTLASVLTDEDEIRTDLTQVTEGYIKLYERYGMLTYRSETGYLDVIEVNEDILKDFLRENGISEVSSVSIEEAFANPKENTLVWSYRPFVYSFMKINSSDSLIGEDLYFLEKSPIQIDGDSNYYDKKIPIFGHIGTGIAEPLRNWQVQYNWVLNQNRNLMEKELGMFFLLDITFLPTEFMDLTGDAFDVLTEMYNTVKDLGFLPIDASKANLQDRGGTQFNSFMTQNVSFTPQIQRNVQLAQMYKMEAMSYLGINPQRMGNPSQYETAEGIKLGQNASYSQTESIFQNLLHDKLSKIEGHIAIAQYAQTNNKDANYIYRASDGELAFIQSISEDENFGARKVKPTPTMDSAKRKDFESLKQTLLQRNTMNTTEEGLAQIMYSDDYLELLAVAKEITARMQQIREQDLQAQQEAQDKEIAYNKEKDEKEMQYKYDQLDNFLDRERIKALGISGRNQNVADPMEAINEQADLALKEQQMDNDNTARDKELAIRFKEASDKVMSKMEELKLQKEALRIKEKEIDTHRFTSIINKN